eukprot:463015-Prorocentrum_minimum.AAC.1
MRQGDHPCQLKVKIHKSLEKDSTDETVMTRVGSACTFPQFRVAVMDVSGLGSEWFTCQYLDEAGDAR